MDTNKQLTVLIEKERDDHRVSIKYSYYIIVIVIIIVIIVFIIVVVIIVVVVIIIERGTVQI